MNRTKPGKKKQRGLLHTLCQRTTSTYSGILFITANIRRRIKTAAAQKDISVSEYCLQAITDQLAREAEMGLKRNDISLETALEKAKRFQAKTFGERSFRVSSGDLIREARK